MKTDTSPASSKPQKPAPKFGGLIKERRRQLNLTLESVAKTVELTKSFLSDIENDKTSPSVASLVRLCDALGLSIGDLFNSTISTVVRADERPKVSCGGTGVSDSLLTASNSSRRQALWTEIEPLGTGGEKLYSLRADEEFIHIVSGTLIVRMEDESFELHAGDSMTFDPRLLHTFLNPSSTERTIAIFVMTPRPS
jgi:DNA-binding XRE family transcriptional regulator